MRKLARVAMMAAALAVLSPLASAYYYWVYFANSSGPFMQVPARFDLNSLQNNTVTYLISDQGPGPLVAGDTFPAIVSQIRAAADVWNGVTTSGIRLAFGGLSSLSTPSSSPEIDIVFDDGDIPPGLLALTKPILAANPGSLVAGGATFVPLLRSRVQLRKDMTNTAVFGSGGLASYQDTFFLTVVHELGHALGLQHTETASAMSTNITRTTTKAAPLTADDIAGISLLYPANGYQASTGSISGRVLLGANGVSMANVVAFSASGTAVSAISNPDGTYRIEGLPQDSYYVYVHPLAPTQQGETYPENIVPPQDTNGNFYSATLGFAGQFYGGTTDWTQSSLVSVTPGTSSDGINFTVQKRNGPSAYDLIVYGYLGPNQAVVQGPPLQAGSSQTLVFAGLSGTDPSGFLQSAPGLSVSTIGGAAQVRPGTVAPYAGYAPYQLMTVDTSPGVSQATPVAVAIALNNDVYVLPNALFVVPSALPLISSVNGSTDAQGNATVTLVGSNLGPATRILFDGAKADPPTVNPDGSLTVKAPPASAGYHATVEALTPDGQTSSQGLGSALPPAFTYGGPGAPGISVSPSPVTAGTDTEIQITGYNTNFVSGQTVVGFGSSDIVVKKVWVVSPGRLVMNVSINPGATVTSTTVSVASGLQLATLTAALQVVPANPNQPTLRTPILNHATHLAGIPVGGVAEINSSGLPSSLAGWVLTIGNQPTPITQAAGGQLLAMVPFGLLPGPIEVTLISPTGVTIPTVLLQVDAAPPVVMSAVNRFGTPIDVSHPVQAGDTITVVANGLLDPLGNLPILLTLSVSVGGVDVTPLSIAQSGVSGVALQVALPASLTPGTAQIAVREDTRVSAAYTIYIH